jgi:TRAP transporter 4TM/12TM fusion protein
MNETDDIDAAGGPGEGLPEDAIVGVDVSDDLPEDVDELLASAKASATGGDGLEVVSRVREFTGFMRWLVMGIAFTYSGYYLYTARFGIQSPEAHRGYYWGFAGVLVFLLYPATKRGLAEGKRHRINPIDLVLSAAFGLLAVYFVVRYPIIVNQGGFLLDYQYYLGWGAILLSLEATRRVVGMALPAIATFFLFYAFYGPSFPGILAHRGLSQERVLSTMYTSFNGIFGPVAAIFATFVFLFIIFGAFLQKSGAGRFFIDLPFAIAGSARGGPAKVAVAVSALMGSVNGSAVANVMTTGSLTIPLMRRVGYSRNFAGGVEAAASTGGQILPPVMGAGAFLIAEFTGIPYVTIVLVSIVPAIMYFLAVYWLVDFEAAKKELQGLPKEDLPDWKQVVARGWYFVLPLVILITLIVQRYSPSYAAFWSIVSIIVIGVLVPYEGKRMTPKDVFDSMVGASIISLTVGGIVGTIGIIVGVINLTGLGLRFSGLIVTWSGGNLWLVLILVTLVSWLLGAGLTVTSSYIVVAILAAPALVEVGVPLLAAHLIIFWVSQDANVTPPIALAAFAGASISGGQPMRTGWEAWKLARGLYIVPVLMAFSPLVVGPFWEAVPVALTAVVGIYLLSAGMSGCLLRRTTLIEQLLLLGAGVLMIVPDLLIAGGGLLIGIAVYLWQRRTRELVTKSQLRYNDSLVRRKERDDKARSLGRKVYD